MRILGIDPGTAICGWAVVDRTGSSMTAVDFGVIRTPAGREPSRRLADIFDALSALIDRLRPEAAAVEQLFFGQNSKTALAVGQARGVVLLALARASLPYVEITPNAVKQAVTGYGGADKRQIQLMVQRIFGLDGIPQPDDAADALAVALAGGEFLRFGRAVDDR
ncbi:MAG: crossover junction endodeoxyribonuclease RuvC [Thermaerobacter sp.]|nr:crossover junction endodeoxyribonuclease RuvC [Thermaerobacter sp.]